MIASFHDGRVRIRANALKDKTNMDMVQSIVSAQDGVQSMTPNLRTGSLLVTYDPAKISREMLMVAAEALEAQFGGSKVAAGPEKSCLPALSRKGEMTLLGGLYGLTVLGGFINMRIHILSGALFTLLTVKHVYDRRRCL